MSNTLERIQNKFPALKCSLDEDGDVLIHGIPGNPDLRIYLMDEDDITDFMSLPTGTLIGVRGVRGFLVDATIYVGLRARRGKHGEDAELLHVHMFYKGHNLTIRVEMEDEPFSLQFYTILGYSGDARMVIEGYTFSDEDTLSDDIRYITNSLFFDIHYNFGHYFELNPIARPRPGRSKRTRMGFPRETLELTYKQYNPELLRYYATAEREVFAPFEFLSYYHVLEYFLDRSAFRAASTKIKSILLLPDFHLRPEHYTSQAVKILKAETERNVNDKAKIVRTLRQFIETDEYTEFLSHSGLGAHFASELSFTDMKLSLPAIDVSSEVKFYETLSRRIYAVRCSIVHSNPDYDESKAVPFVANDNNIALLRTETALLNLIARQVILKSTEAVE